MKCKRVIGPHDQPAVCGKELKRVGTLPPGRRGGRSAHTYHCTVGHTTVIWVKGQKP